MSEETMTCERLMELITTYLDDALNADDLARFDHHLAQCDGCQDYLEQFRATIRTVGRIRDDDLEPAYRERLLEAFRDFG